MVENKLENIVLKSENKISEIIVLKLQDNIQNEKMEPLFEDKIILNAAYKELIKEADTITDNIDKEIAAGEMLAQKAGGEHTPENTQTAITEAKASIGAEVKALIQHAGILTATVGKIRFEAVNEYYNRVLTEGITDIRLGRRNIHEVMKSAVKDLSRSGLRTVNYQSGHVNKLPVAVRRAVLTELQHITNDIHEEIAQQIGTKYFEVDAHPGARPTHAEWQGKVYSYEQLVTVCGLGSVDGLCGANCYHSYYPFVPGVSVPKYTAEILSKYKAPNYKEYGGKTFSQYEAKQKQRQMETAMRKVRTEITLLKKLGMDEDAVKLRSKYTAQRHNYKEFSEKMGLKTYYNRVTIDGLGRC